MPNDDVIQPKSSSWASPVVMAKKKDGSLRFCSDYRKLNQTTKKDVYPLPRIDDSLDRLRHARYFSSMDVNSGYWEMEFDERDREKTAFVTPDGLYVFKVLPFGWFSAPATFQSDGHRSVWIEVANVFGIPKQRRRVFQDLSRALGAIDIRSSGYSSGPTYTKTRKMLLPVQRTTIARSRYQSSRRTPGS